MRRIGNQDGLQFDVAARDFTMTEGITDAAPFVHGFELTPKGSTSRLEIEFGWRPMESMPPDPALTFSKYVEERSFFDDKGRPIGEDHWGYLNTGERWRRVRFSGGIVAKYGFLNQKEAELFDRVISSACFLSSGT